MSNISKQQQKQLRENRYVASCTDSAIEYTPEFKRHALKQSAHGVYSRDIFTAAGIPIVSEDPEYTAKRLRFWRALANKHGLAYFDQEHRGRTGVPAKQAKVYNLMTKEQKRAYLEAENEALEYVRSHFGLPPSLRKPSHSSRRRKNIKS